MLPLVPGGKRPLVKGGYKAATTDPSTIDAWAATVPNANIGWRCGSGLVCIDIDYRNGGHETLSRALKDVGPLPPTWSVKTPGGVHHWFAGDVPTRQNLGGIDVLAEGRYAVAPHSVRGTALYRQIDWCDPAPLPAELVPWLLADTQRAVPDTTRPRRTAAPTSDQPRRKLPGKAQSLPKRAEQLLAREKRAGDVYDRDADVLSVMLSMVRCRWTFEEARAALTDPAHGLSQKLLLKSSTDQSRELTRTWNRAVQEVRTTEAAHRRIADAVNRIRLPPRAGGFCLSLIRWALAEAVSDPASSSLQCKSRLATWEVPATCRTVAADLGTTKSTIHRATNHLRAMGILNVQLKPGRTMKDASTWRFVIPMSDEAGTLGTR